MPTSGSDAVSPAAADLRATLEASFSTSYLTLISILQGAVLGYMVATIDAMTTDGRRGMDLPQWILAAAILLVIVGVWQEYMMGVTLFNWIPTLIDALIPFTIGVAQVFLVRSLRQGAGTSEMALVSFGAFLTVALIGYENMFRRSHNGNKRNELVLSLIWRFRILTPLLFGGLAVLSFLAVASGRYAGEGRSLEASLLLLGSTLANYPRLWYYWDRVVRRSNGDAAA